GRGHRHGVPELRAVPVADGAGERAARPGGSRHAGAGDAPALAAGDRPHRPRRLRVRLSARALRRYAPAGGLRARAGGASQHPAHGRTVFRSRCADRRNVAQRLPQPVGRGAVANQVGAAGDAQHRGGGGDVRPAADLPAIAQALHMEVDDLFPAAEALQLLRLAEVEGGDIRLTEAGLQFARDDTDDRKKLFARHLVTYVPLAAHVRRVLDERASHSAPKSRFFDELEDYMAEEAAEQTLRTIISWGRYGEVFAYDDHRQAFSLENPA